MDEFDPMAMRAWLLTREERLKREQEWTNRIATRAHAVLREKGLEEAAGKFIALHYRVIRLEQEILELQKEQLRAIQETELSS